MRTKPSVQMKITPQVLAKMLRTKPDAIRGLSSFQKYRERLYLYPAGKKDREAYMRGFLERHSRPYLRIRKAVNRKVWERGWSENLRLIRKHGIREAFFRPKYFRGSRFLRLNKVLWKTRDPKMETYLFEIVREWLAERYLGKFNGIVELGAGSGQNLYFLSQRFPEKKLIGTDWVRSCVTIYQILGKNRRNVRGRLQDMTSAAGVLPQGRDQAFLSIHSFEQLGKNHNEILKKILVAKPGLVVQLEPLKELYSLDNYLDMLALLYHEKRNYLDGYLPKLRDLQKQGKIRILTVLRPCIGGVLHEASLVVWKPL